MSQVKIKLFLIFYFTVNCAVAQITEATKSDSIRIYNDIESYSKQSKFRKIVYKIFFKPAKPLPHTKQKIIIKKDRRLSPSFAPFQDKIIRNIHVTTLDPFGYSILDTAVYPDKFISKLGNTLHKKTLSLTINNLLLIKTNKPFDFAQSS